MAIFKLNFLFNICIYVSKNWDFLEDDPTKKNEKTKGEGSILLKSCDDIICDMYFIL
jgi:hypothetical protein